MPHITINGAPLCQHLADGGDPDFAAVDHEDARLCQHAWDTSAHEVAHAWRKAFPKWAVDVVRGACPRLVTLSKPRAD